MDDLTPAQPQQDVLLPFLAKAYANFGQDVNTPEVQAQIQDSATRLRATNPGVDDATLAKQVATNLPSLASTVIQNKPTFSQNNVQQSTDIGFDPKAQYQALQAQRQQDMQRANDLRPLSNVFAGPNPGNTAGDIAAKNDFLSQAFLPSKTMEQGITDASNTFKASSEAEAAKQAGMKTESDAITLRDKQATSMSDPNSPLSKSIVQGITPIIAKMVIASGMTQEQAAPYAESLKTMNGVAAMALADNLSKQLKSSQEQQKAQADLKEVLAGTVRQDAVAKANVNASNASAGAANAGAALTRAQTQGVQSENIVKKNDADISTKSTAGYLNGTGGTSLEGAPAATFQKYATKGQQDQFNNNTKLVDGLAAGSNDRADIMNQIDQTLELISKASTGPWSKMIAPIDSQLQQISKNLAGLEAKQQLGQSTSAGSLSAAAATPDISKYSDTTRAYLINLKATINRQESVANAGQAARENNTLASFDPIKEAVGTQSWILPGGKMITLSPQKIKDGVLKQVQQMGGIPVVNYHGAKQ